MLAELCLHAEAQVRHGKHTHSRSGACGAELGLNLKKPHSRSGACGAELGLNLKKQQHRGEAYAGEQRMLPKR